MRGWNLLISGTSMRVTWESLHGFGGQHRPRVLAETLKCTGMSVGQVSFYRDDQTPDSLVMKLAVFSLVFSTGMRRTLIKYKSILMLPNYKRQMSSPIALAFLILLLRLHIGSSARLQLKSHPLVHGACFWVTLSAHPRPHFSSSTVTAIKTAPKIILQQLPSTFAILYAIIISLDSYYILGV